jgi:hypothetical protein
MSGKQTVNYAAWVKVDIQILRQKSVLTYTEEWLSGSYSGPYYLSITSALNSYEGKAEESLKLRTEFLKKNQF